MSDVEKMESERATLAAESKALIEQVAPINARLSEIYKRDEELRRAIFKEKVKGDPAGWDWGLVLFEDGSGIGYEVLDKYLRDKFGCGTSGYAPEIEERVIQIVMRRDDKEAPAKVKAMVREFLPRLTARDDGTIWFSIFERTLSETGSYYLCVEMDGSSAQVRKVRGRSSQRVLFAGFVDNCVDYIGKNVYYE